MRPGNFSWVIPDKLAGFSRPTEPESLKWLRSKGVELVMTLTEGPWPRTWVNDAGLICINEPIEDYCAPTLEQLERIVQIIQRAHDSGMGVGVHCHAGVGRTGTILAAVLVTRGMTSQDALAKVRIMRPGSVEMRAQEQVLHEFGAIARPKPRPKP